MDHRDSKFGVENVNRTHKIESSLNGKLDNSNPNSSRTRGELSLVYDSKAVS